jgi:hypothetical protein
VTRFSTKVSGRSLVVMVDSPNCEVVSPFHRVRLVHCNDFNQRSAGIATLNVNRAASLGHATEEAAGAIFVVGIVFDHLAGGDRLADFMDSDLTHDRLIKRVFGELKLFAGDLVLDFFDNRFKVAITHFIFLDSGLD